MQAKEIRTLALNPGSRYVGIAVFHGTELIDWAVKSIRRTSHRKRIDRLKSVVREAAERDSINCLAVKRVHPSRRSEFVGQVTTGLKRWASQNGQIIREYSIKEIEASLIYSQRLNKRSLMEEIAARFPFLYPELEKERHNRNSYSVRMFEAVALGTKCVNDLEKTKGRKSISHIQ